MLKKIFFVILVVFAVLIIVPILTGIVTFLPELLDSKNYKPIDTAQISPSPTYSSYYSEVSQQVKNMTLDCEDKGFLPPNLRNTQYYCANIYQVDPVGLFSQYAASGKASLLFFGQDSYFICPQNLGNNRAVIEKCYRAARFFDNWQIPKMKSLYQISSLQYKVLVYYPPTNQELTHLCGLATASACMTFYRNGNYFLYYLYIYPPASLEKFYDNIYPASVYEGVNKEIAYSFTVNYPTGCLLTHTHEVAHYFNELFLGFRLGEWFDESLTYFITANLDKYLCPGFSLTNIYRKKSGRSEPLTNFEFNDNDLAEPMSAAIESYSEGNNCRKAIFMKLAQLKKETGSLSFIVSFLTEIKEMNHFKEQDYINALIRSQGSPESLKVFFREKGCL